jgi:hypothetical protein
MKLEALGARKSLLLFSKESVVRYHCMNILDNRLFDPTILFLILLNTLVFIVQDYRTTDNWQYRLSVDTELFFLVAFTVESGIKIIAMGLILDDNSYLR